MPDTMRATCCWTHCDNEQGVGTWTEINGEALPVCEEHWFGNIDAERRHLRAEVEQLRALGQALHDALQGATVYNDDDHAIAVEALIAWENADA